MSYCLLFFTLFLTQVRICSSPCTLFEVPHPGGIYNIPRGALDLYTPRFVKGKGVEKVGICPICIEPPSRGGEKKKLWLAMKFSAFKWYVVLVVSSPSILKNRLSTFSEYLYISTTCFSHSFKLSYAIRSRYATTLPSSLLFFVVSRAQSAGISASTGRPFSPPTAFRTTPRINPGKKEKLQIQQGKCHKCQKWIAVEGIKDMESKVTSSLTFRCTYTDKSHCVLIGQGTILVRIIPRIYLMVFARFPRRSLSDICVGGSMPRRATRNRPWKEKVTTTKRTTYWLRSSHFLRRLKTWRNAELRKRHCARERNAFVGHIVFTTPHTFSGLICVMFQNLGLLLPSLSLPPCLLCY